MKRSEIFESFVKIAEEKGLVSKATPESNKEYLEKTHRADSLSIDDISKLYNKKPNAPKDMEYQRNIVEIAHPEPLVLFRSYDKLNALIENINERQDILLHIVNKTNDGQIPQRKYAKKNLLLSLVRVGNDMDNRGEVDLASFADTCLMQASMKKTAQINMLGGSVLLISAVLGAIYAKQHLPFHSDGFEQDYEKAISELDDLLNSNTNFQVGYEYTPQLIERVNEIKNKLAELNTAVQAVLPQLEKIDQPHTTQELLQLIKDPGTHQALASLQDFKKTVFQMRPYLKQVVSDFTNESYKQRQIAQKGWFTKVIDSTSFLHGGAGFISDDFDDVAHALQTLQTDVDAIAKTLAGSDNMAAIYQRELQQAQTGSPDAGTTAPTAAPAGGETPTSGAPATEEAPTAQTSPVQQNQMSNLEQEMSEYFDSMVGGGG